MITDLILPAFGTTVPALNGIQIQFFDNGEPAADADIVLGTAAFADRQERELTWTGPVICVSQPDLTQHGTPSEPRRLQGHMAIAVAGQSAASWRLGQGTRRMPPLSISVADKDAATAAIADLGLVQLPDYVVAKAIADCRLTRVLEAHDPPPKRIHASLRNDPGLGRGG